MMASTVYILLLLCACTFALPKERFTRGVQYCAPQTPCSWGIYNAGIKDVTQEVVNTYCTCATGKVCAEAEEDVTSSTLIYRCRDPENTS